MTKRSFAQRNRKEKGKPWQCEGKRNNSETLRESGRGKLNSKKSNERGKQENREENLE